MSQAGRCHIIVGGTSGIGLAAAALLASQGDRVALIGRDEDAAQAKAARLAALGGGEVVGCGGIGPGLDEAVRRVADRLGGVDGLAITAGPIHARGRLGDLDDAAWEDAFQTQLMTVVRATRAAIPLLAARGGGSIVTVAAMSIRIQKAALPHYAAMKSAIASLTKNIANTYGEAGIRANCIAPGAIATEALGDSLRRAAAEFGGDPLAALWRLMRREWGVNAALDRIGEPDEVAQLIGFLLSSKAGYLTGALINIDGGSDF